MNLVLTNMSPRISRLVTQIQAQSSHSLAYVLFVLHKNVNSSTLDLTCEMIVLFILSVGI